MEIRINYIPYPKQLEIHQSPHRFKVVAAGRRFGKTTLAINELLRSALEFSEIEGEQTPRSWYICDTYKHAEMVAWKEFQRWCPRELIKVKNINKLIIELVNGHLIEFKGSEDPDKLRGVSLVFVVLDEYGQMKPEVWTEIIRPMLMDRNGKALFIGTPSSDGSPHFHDLYKKGQLGDPDWKSWLRFTKDNPKPEIQVDVIQAKKDMPPEIYRREFESDFSITAGLIYDNFKSITHVIPKYEPDTTDLIIGSIDPGLFNPTAAILVAWDLEGVGRVFWEYYEKEKLASENALEIKKQVSKYKVGYWIIDRASTRRDMATGITVFNKYVEHLKPLVTAPNDPGTVWTGIDEVKKLFHIDSKLNQPKLFICSNLYWTLWELGRYSKHRYKFVVEKNEKEAPRKKDDHIMDCLRNMVVTKPWMRRQIRIINPIVNLKSGIY